MPTLGFRLLWLKSMITNERMTICSFLLNSCSFFPLCGFLISLSPYLQRSGIPSFIRFPTMIEQWTKFHTQIWWGSKLQAFIHLLLDFHRNSCLYWFQFQAHALWWIKLRRNARWTQGASWADTRLGWPVQAISHEKVLHWY